MATPSNPNYPSAHKGRPTYENARVRGLETSKNRLGVCLVAIKSLKDISRNLASETDKDGYWLSETRAAAIVVKLREAVNELQRSYEAALANPTAKVKAIEVELPE